MAKVEEQIEELIKDKVEAIGYELYDVLYLKEGKNRILRIVIDSENGITLDDCEKVNDKIKDEIDKIDLIDEQYFFEVSSPGVERILRKDWQLKKFIGKEVEIKLFQKDEKGKKNYKGILNSINDEYIEIEDREKIQIGRKKISQIRTVFNY